MTVARPVVLDNTVLSNLARVARTDLIDRLWSQSACTTPAVMKEYAAGVESGVLPQGCWSELFVTEVTEEEDLTRRALPSRLGEGEKSCIAVARHRDHVLVTDDLDARKAASLIGIPTTGTIGVLVLCVKQGMISLAEGNSLLQLLIDQGYRAPVDKLDTLVLQ